MKRKIYSTTYLNKIQYKDYKFCGEDFEILNYMYKSLLGVVKSINEPKKERFIKVNTGRSLRDLPNLTNNIGFYLETCKKQLNIC